MQPVQAHGSGTVGTSLYCYRARYHDATFRRFISEDAARFKGRVDFYDDSQSEDVHWLVSLSDTFHLAFWSREAAATPANRADNSLGDSIPGTWRGR